MTETEARELLLLQAHEERADSPHWRREDRAWATRQALALVGHDATPEQFALARAQAALPQLAESDESGGRWLARRAWHPIWVWGAVGVGAVAGLLADQLGAPERVNLLAPAVWAVVAWNLAVYLTLVLWPLRASWQSRRGASPVTPSPAAPSAAARFPAHGLRAWLGRWLGGPGSSARTSASRAEPLWWQASAGLTGDRVALVLHTAAAALALGLMAGMYLRGLVLDYRAGWQSTFLDAHSVQQGLNVLLAPASALTGTAVPDVAPLRVKPGEAASASAAPWIHLYATTLLLFVVLPRAALALVCGWRVAHTSKQFPLPLDTPYFESLHPLMRPGQPRALRLLWRAPADVPARLFGHDVTGAVAPRTLLESDESDQLELLPATDTTARELARTADALLLALPSADAPWPAWARAAARPVLVLIDSPAVLQPAVGQALHLAADGGQALHLAALADGWLQDGHLLDALAHALPDDPRLPRLRATWQRAQRQRLHTVATELAHTLAAVACTRQPVAEPSGLLSRRSDADAARAQLTQALEAELRAHADRLAALLGQPVGIEDAPVQRGHTGTALAPHHALAGAAASLRPRVGEGRAALAGGVLAGALTGLKADLATGGLTMGAGALVGAVGAAGAARGLNVVRGTDRSHVVWDADALARLAEKLVAHALVTAYGLNPEAAATTAAAALESQASLFDTLWRSRSAGSTTPEGEARALEASLQAPLLLALHHALGGPPIEDPVPGVRTQH